MKQYHNFLDHILTYGVRKEDRTGTGTISAVVPPQMRFDLSKGFPIVTTKKVNLPTVAHELKWFTKGDTNIKYLVDNEINIWNMDAYRFYKETHPNHQVTIEEFVDYVKTIDAFAAEYGELGPIYGAQWRSWPVTEEWFSDELGLHLKTTKIDQLANVVEDIKQIKSGNHKSARRLIISAWNVGQLKGMALPPCHVLIQFFVVGNKLSCHLYQRSGDAFLGVPFNISSYALLTHIIAAQTELEVGEFIHTVGDAHIYLNHIDQVYEQLSRSVLLSPKLIMPDKEITIDNWEPEDFILDDYRHHPAIKGDLSV